MTDAPTPRPSGDVPSRDDATIGKLVADASRDLSSLLRGEIALAKSELKISVKAGGIGLGLFGAAAFLALLGVVILSVACGFLLHLTGLKLAWCFLVVAFAYFLVAALLAFVGIRKVKQVRAPERAIHQAQEARGILKRG
jgi:hypothetical protein